MVGPRSPGVLAGERQAGGLLTGELVPCLLLLDWGERWYLHVDWGSCL